MKPAHQCEKCRKVFTLKCNLRRHIKNFHNTVQISKNVIRCGQGNFICNVCNKKFTRKDNLSRHLKTEHPSSLDDDCTVYICDHCSSTFSRKSNLIRHLQKFNSQHETVNLKFNSMADFLKWKTQIEKELFCTYNIFRRYKGKFRETITYICHRSGYSNKIEKRKRRPTMRGSKKVEGNCPSRMIVIKRGDKLDIKFIKTHLFHKCEPNELKHVRFSSESQDLIATKLSAGIPSHRIIKDVRCNLEFNDSVGLKEKIQLITSKDVRNIASLKNVKNDRRHPNDAIATHSYVVENGKSILYYKKQGDIDPQNVLLQDDFVLIIMKDCQAEKLRKFGSDVICFDATHGTNEYDFLLHTLLVIDEYAEGFPCAFMISNRNDAVVCEIMINCILKTIGEIKTKTLMSDMQLSYQNAWLKVMPEPDYLLFCTWHVKRAWTKNLSALIKDSVKREEIKTDLDDLQTSMCVKDFDKKLSTFLSKNDPEINSFIEYFRSNYSTNYEMWAYSYRIHAGINTNMFIERFHRTLKYEFANGKKISQVQDICKIIDDYIANRKALDLIHKTKGNISYRTQKSRVSHDRAVELLEKNESESNVRICDDGTFNVNTYTITKVPKNCDGIDGTCPQMCDICNICAHEFTCSCPHNAIKSIMCKHIHLVGLCAKKNTTHSQSLSSSISLPSLRLPDPDILDEADLQEREMLDLLPDPEIRGEAGLQEREMLDLLPDPDVPGEAGLQEREILDLLPDPAIPDEADLKKREILDVDVEPERVNTQRKRIDRLRKYFEVTLQNVKSDQQFKYFFNMMKKIKFTIQSMELMKSVTYDKSNARDRRLRKIVPQQRDLFHSTKKKKKNIKKNIKN